MIGSSSNSSETDLSSTKGGRGQARPASRVSSIKKIINKKIKMNSHVKFDDDGVEEDCSTSVKRRYSQLDTNGDKSDSDVGDSITLIPISEYEAGMDQELNIGGIEISKAQERIMARDKIDKKLERERRQQIHQERKRKNRKNDIGHSVTTAMLRRVPDEEGAIMSEEDVPQAKRRRVTRGAVSNGEGAQQLGQCMEPQLKDDELLAKHLLGL